MTLPLRGPVLVLEKLTLEPDLIVSDLFDPIPIYSLSCAVRLPPQKAIKQNRLNRQLIRILFWWA